MSDTTVSSWDFLKHRPPDFSNRQGITKKCKENHYIVIDKTAEKDGHAKEKQLHIKNNANSAGRNSDWKFNHDGNDNIKTAEAMEFTTMATLFEQIL